MTSYNALIINQIAQWPLPQSFAILLRMVIILLGIATFCATMLGGLLALKLKDTLHLILGFSAGAVVAVAFFDLLPEALTLSTHTYDISTVVSCTALGFLLYLVLDRTIALHDHAEHTSATPSRGSVRAGSFSIHSFLDGVGIGLAFHVSPAIGVIVTSAVLAHDFSDGINTVSVVVRHGGTRTRALRWLIVDASAPLAGIVVTQLYAVSEETLGLLLAIFAGFFLYIGASDLIPESYHQHPKFLTTGMTVLGAAVIYLVIHIAG